MNELDGELGTGIVPAFLRRGGREADGAVGHVREALRLFEVTNQRVRRWPSRRLPFVAAGVDSPDLPACIFHAPGDPAVIAPDEGP